MQDTPDNGDSSGNDTGSVSAGHVIEQQIERELHDSYLTYAMSTIMDRALPDVRDGLKPSQRRILVAMNDLNLGPRAKHRKCAKIAGDTSGNYHPHGESVIYPTLVNMGQDWKVTVSRLMSSSRATVAAVMRASVYRIAAGGSPSMEPKLPCLSTSM